MYNPIFSTHLARALIEEKLMQAKQYRLDAHAGQGQPPIPHLGTPMRLLVNRIYDHMIRKGKNNA